MRKVRRIVAASCVALAIVAGAVAADAGVYYFKPNFDDYSLNQSRAYLWGGVPKDGGGNTIPGDEYIVSATLTISNIYDADYYGTNYMRVSLLDRTGGNNPIPVGVSSYYDSNHYNDYFLDKEGYTGISLVTYSGISKNRYDRDTLVYEFEKSEIDVLEAYIADDNAGIGFDPDCDNYYYHCGITLMIETDEEQGPHEEPNIPEPFAGSILLGGIGMILARRRRRRS